MQPYQDYAENQAELHITMNDFLGARLLQAAAHDHRETERSRAQRSCVLLKEELRSCSRETNRDIKEDSSGTSTFWDDVLRSNTGESFGSPGPPKTSKAKTFGSVPANDLRNRGPVVLDRLSKL